MNVLTTQAFLKNSYHFLNNVVINLDRQDVQGVESLLIKLTGSTSAYLMINKLFYWWQHTKSKERWVYKSWRDWESEIALSRNQTSYVHEQRQLEKIGVERRRIQIAGKGTPIHYRFHLNGLLRAIAKFANVSIMTIISWMLSEQSESAKTEKHQVKQKTTKSKKTTNSVVINLPIISGMKADLVQILVDKFGLEKVLAMRDYAIRQKANNQPGFILQGLHQNWEIQSSREFPKIDKNPFQGMRWQDIAD